MNLNCLPFQNPVQRVKNRKGNKYINRKKE